VKLRAIRLRDIGPFATPVALEGLGGALDVLIGPNEHGKSTLLGALRAAFFWPHTTQDNDLKRLSADTGGHPLVEVEFETAGRRLAIRKQFAGRRKSASAELVDIATARTLAKGEAAEAELAEFIGGRRKSEGPAGLLWLSQGDLLANQTLGADGAATLRDLIEREVATTASGGGARQLILRVEALIRDEYETARGAPPANSAFGKARTEQARVAAELAKAQSALDGIEALLSELAQARAVHAEKVAPDRIALLDREVERSSAAAKAGEEARLARDRTEAEMRAARLVHEKASAARERLSAQIERHGKLVASIAANEAKRVSLAGEREAAQAALTAALRRLDGASRDLAAMRADLGRAELWALRSRLADATAREASIRELEKSLAALRISPELLDRIEAADGQVMVLGARVAAAAPVVRFDLEKGAIDRVRAGRARVPAKGEVVVQEPLLIEIEGVGRITIAPGAGVEQARDLEQLKRLEAELAELLVRAGAASLPDAAAKDRERRDLVARCEAERARLAAAAPKGHDALERQIAEVTRALGGAAGELGSLGEPRGDLEQRRRDSEAAVEAARSSVRKAEERLQSIALAEAKATAEHDHQRASLAELSSLIPNGEAAAAELAGLDKHEREADARASEAIRTHRAFADASPAAAALAELVETAAKAGAAREASRRETAELARRLARLEGEIAVASAGGSGESIAELDGELERLDREVGRFERDRDGLRLLLATLKAAVAETRTRFLAPVRDRLHALLPLVFPGMAIDLDDDFSAEQVVRQETAEPADRLSGGTREQIAVLVRLAFARLLTDAGRPLPLVLDDPLVYADDARLGRMFEALAAASRAHQVVVLTCHARAFAPLIEAHGGRRLELVPWRPD